MIYPLETSDPFHFLQIFSSAQTQRLGTVRKESTKKGHSLIDVKWWTGFAHNFGVAMSWGNKIHVMSHFFFEATWHRLVAWGTRIKTNKLLSWVLLDRGNYHSQLKPCKFYENQWELKLSHGKCARRGAWKGKWISRVSGPTLETDLWGKYHELSRSIIERRQSFAILDCLSFVRLHVWEKFATKFINFRRLSKDKLLQPKNAKRIRIMSWLQTWEGGKMWCVSVEYSRTVTRQLAKKRVRVREPERPLVYIFKIDIIFFFLGNCSFVYKWYFILAIVIFLYW